MKKTTKKTGGDKESLKGGKKKSDNSTSYVGAKPKPKIHNVKPPNYPYGQLHKAVKPKPKK